MTTRSHDRARRALRWPRPARLGRAALGGFVATLPMTLLMLALHRRLPASERYPLPPRLITDRLTQKTGVLDEADEPARVQLAFGGHFAYGAAAGALYGLIPPRAHAAPSGMVFGLAVWSASYLGLLPAVGLMSPATRHPLRRTGLMVAAHLVWGVGVAIVTESRERRPRG